ncbi:zinc-binding dehydrogenase [Ferrimonas sp. YFM]|uniref:quinone oxidoreductase family protein n=1 Tax=Ferrimonas sp. YFM TaxID=3028878 RepID=UPI00257465B8|nr:zinc-binding dehydrogenase [Ferrimonas sp. YFM]BDY04172.1 quinone oxidoreductase [Ferrimonas sp. YFM]
MKAISIKQTGAADTLEYLNVDTPTLKTGEVLVKIAAAPVNFIDTIIREGNMPPGMMPELPIIPGVEGSGTIVDANNTELKPGQKVAFLGPIGASAYAEYAAVPADRLVTLSGDADLLEAAVLPVNYFTAYHMLHNVVRAQPGKTALIYAASGGVGTALIQLAKNAGLTVVGLERKAEKLANGLSQGADFMFDTSDDNWVEQVKQATGGEGVDYIFNPVAGDTIVQDLELLKPLGHVVIFGLLGGAGETNLQAEAFKHFGKAPTITYSEIYATFFNDYPLVESSMKALYQLLDEGKIKPVYSTLPLSEAAEAHRTIEAGKVTGKLLLIP